MDALEAIYTRRSVRKYTDKALTQEEIDILMKAAMQAPSAGNGQPWEFVIITNKEAREKIAAMNVYANMAKDAPMTILVCGNLSRTKMPQYWQQDCSAVVQNIMLAAHAIGLGTVWTGIYPEEDRVAGFSKTFNLPENVLPLGAIVVGHPANDTPQVDRYDESRIHFEKY